MDERPLTPQLAFSKKGHLVVVSRAALKVQIPKAKNCRANLRIKNLDKQVLLGLMSLLPSPMTEKTTKQDWFKNCFMDCKRMCDHIKK